MTAAAASFPTPSPRSTSQPLAAEADEAIDATEAQDVFSPAVIADCLLVLGSKQADLSNYFAYYAGTAAPPLVADRLREIYRDLNFVLSENWSAVVVDTTTDRIELQGASGPDEATTAELTTIIQEAELLLEADDAHQRPSSAARPTSLPGRIAPARMGMTPRWNATSTTHGCATSSTTRSGRTCRPWP